VIFAFDEFELDAERLELRRSGAPLKVDALVLRLLVALVRNPGQLVSKDELVDDVWEGRAVADNVLTVSMARLRKTLGHARGAREFVINVYGRGYRFVRPVIARTAPANLAPAPPHVASAAAPFVGRERVLSRLHDALGEAIAGRGRVCALSGEAGIGKTGVVEAFERALPPGRAEIAWGYCREGADTPPLWPWLRVLRGVVEPDELARLTQQLGEAGRDPGGQGFARHHGFDAILRAVSAAAERAPRVLVFDDLHRADSASLELLGMLVDEIARARVLVIATLRHARGRRAPRPETLLPYVLGHRNCERIALERLRAEDVAAYVGALLDDGDGEIGRAVFEKSEGNPFFMAELARDVRDAPAPGATTLAVSDSALELIRQRVVRLDAPARELLAAAAVIGRSFELPLLSLVLGREPAALIADLDAALDAEIAVAAPDSVTAFAFGHELLRAVLADALPPRERRRLHLRAGEALEQRQRAGDAVAASDLAYHFYAALPDSDPRKTVDVCRAAAEAAAAAFANADVVRYTRHALEALELVPAPSARLRMGLSMTIAVYARGHAPREAARALHQALRLAREHGDGRSLVRAGAMLNPHPGYRPHPEGVAALEPALPLLDPNDDGDRGARAIALATLAYSAPNAFSRGDAEALIAEAEHLARGASAEHPLRVALAAKLYVQGGPAHAASRPAVEAELERLAREFPTRMRVLPAELALHRALDALQRGDAAAMNAAIERAVLRCRELRHLELSWHSQRFAALARVNAGMWPAGLTALEALHRQAEQRAIFGSEPFCAFDRAVVFGELSEALVLDDALRSALEFTAGDPPSLWSLNVRALAAAGLHDEARAALGAVAPAALAQLPCDANYLGTLGHLARGALAIGARAYYEPLYALLAPYPGHFAAHVAFSCEGSVAQLLGMLAAALGRHDAAIAHFTRGVAENDRFGLLPRAAEARLQLARCLNERAGAGDAVRARTLAGEAAAIAARLGMQRLGVEADALT
jgi:DNA-binding winged helix-turn-helix (wHTH) protein